MRKSTLNEIVSTIVEKSKDDIPAMAYQHSNGKYNEAAIIFDNPAQLEEAIKNINPVINEWIKAEKIIGIKNGLIIGSILTGGIIIGGYFIKRRYNKKKNVTQVIITDDSKS